MIAVSLLDWLRTGQFGPVRLGFSRAQLQDLLGRPDDMGGTSRKHRTPAIWKYGDIEFHFGGRDDPLYLIHLDDFAIPTGGPAIAFDPWIVRGGLLREEVEWILSAQGIAYRRVASYDHDSNPDIRT
jgi:hypothetical protein